MLRIDHVILATNDIQKAAQHVRTQWGLNCFQGGLHSDGTRTWVVPLGPRYMQYLEILTVEDPALALKDPFGQWLLGRLKEDHALFFVNWALQTDEIDKICARLHLEPFSGSVTRPNGSRSSWIEAGFEQTATSGWLPFFIQYDGLAERRERAAADLLRAKHAIEPLEISWIELGGDQKRLSEWLGNAQLPLRVVDTHPGVRSVGIMTTRGEVIVQ